LRCFIVSLKKNEFKGRIFNTCHCH
jgi:hypothetical protein